jgi:hypothetical protein
LFDVGGHPPESHELVAQVAFDLDTSGLLDRGDALETAIEEPHIEPATC